MSRASNRCRAVCVMGPTASGKTGLAVELAQELNGEIISVDSALVYRGMDIGTAKPTPTEMAGVPHHLIDTRDPANAYSAADFRADALQLIDEVSARGHLPILTGGTMLYFKALKHGLAVMPEANQQVRDDISERGDALGWSVIHDELAQVDPKAAERINPNDRQRLQRALEVYLISGKPLSAWQSEPLPGCPVDLIELAIVPPDRQMLHQRIDARFRQMLELGLVAEVDALYRREDLHRELPAIKSVGYRQVWAYLESEIDFETMVQKGIIATRQLAKRQYTWLRSWEDLRVIDAPLRSEALKILG